MVDARAREAGEQVGIADLRKIESHCSSAGKI
jgi:hypothetical protein